MLVLLSSWHGITDGKFDASKANQAELEKFKQKYAGKPIEFRQPALQAILAKRITMNLHACMM